MARKCATSTRIRCSIFVLFLQLKVGKLGEIRRPANTASTVRGPNRNDHYQGVIEMAEFQPTLEKFLGNLPTHVIHEGTYEVPPRGTYRRWSAFPIWEKDAQYVYIILDKNEEIVYVGRAVNLQARIQGHVRKSWWGASQVVVALLVYGDTAQDAERNAFDVERAGIDLLSPWGNVAPGGRWRGRSTGAYELICGGVNG